MDKQQFKGLLRRLSEYKADPENLLAALDLIQELSLKGVVQEKVNAKTSEPVQVIEIYPDIARRCVTDKWQLVKDLMDLSQDEDANPSSMELTINIGQLQDDRGEAPEGL